MSTLFRVSLLRIVLFLLRMEAKCTNQWLEKVLQPFAKYCVRETDARRAVQKARFKSRVDDLSRDFDALQEEGALLSRNVGSAQQADIQVFLVRQSTLSTRCQCLIVEMKAAPRLLAPGTNLLSAHLDIMKLLAVRRLSLSISISRIAQQINAPHFYLNLFLTIVLPTSSSEFLIGDLEEEYALLLDSQGMDRAKAWHRRQAAYSIASAFWQFIAGLAALLTIGDAIERLWKRH
jgi:hypothetical protein